MTRDLTWQCDGANCEHETSVRHERGTGVFCGEHAEVRCRNAFDRAAEEREQAAAIELARRTVPQDE